MQAAAPARSERPARVLIVDDHPILRHGIAQLVQRETDLEPCGETDTVEHALQLIASQQVDLVIVDLSLHERSGIDLIRTLRERHPHVRCLVLSMHDEALHAERALRAGARGYVMKQEATKKIIVALRCIRDGHIYVSEALGSRLLERLTAAPPVPAAGGLVSPLAALSERELEVLRLIGAGLKTGEIARALHRSVHTVEAHRSNIKRKLGLKTGGALAQAAFRSVQERGTTG